MTIQWTLVAAFLYLELAFIFLLLLPFISPKVWQYVLYSRVLRVIVSKANIYFTVFIIVLIFFFLDSVREMLNYSNQTSVDLGQELQIHLKLFRSQRNYYISGFTVFLSLVIRKLIMLVLDEADLLSENESAMKRAQNATETATKILKKKEEVEKEKSIISQVSIMEINELRRAVEETENELKRTRETMESIKQRSLALAKDYDILLEKREALLNQSRNKEKNKETDKEDIGEEKLSADEDEEKSESQSEDEEKSDSQSEKEEKSESQSEEEEKSKSWSEDEKSSHSVKEGSKLSSQ